MGEPTASRLRKRTVLEVAASAYRERCGISWFPRR